MTTNATVVVDSHKAVAYVDGKPVPVYVYGASGGGGGASLPADGDKGDVVVAGSWNSLTVESATPSDGSFDVTGSVAATAGGSFGGPVTVPDDPFAVGWDGSAQVPTKNAVYDKVSTIVGLANDAVTNAYLANMAALSVKANATNATADPTDLAAATDANILRRSGTTLGFGAIDLAAAGAVGTSRLTAANLLQGSALSVLGVAGNATANLASIAAASDGQVLRRSGTALAFGAVDLASANAVTGDLPLANLAPAAAASTLLGRGSASAGDWQALTLGTNLSITGTTLNAASGGGVSDAPFDISWDGDTTNAPSKNAAYDAFYPQAQTVLHPGTNVTFSLDGTAKTITINASAGAGTGEPADGDKGDIIVLGGVWSIDSFAVQNTQLRQSVATSVIGRDAGTTGTVADIVAGSDGQVLRRSAGLLGFGTVANAGLANMAALTVKANATNAVAAATDLAAALDGQVLLRSGTTLAFGAVSLSNTNAVTGRLPATRIPQGSAFSVLGVSGGSPADVSSLVAGTDGNVLRRSGSTLDFGSVNLASASAVTGDLPFANIVPATAASKLVGRGGASGAGDFEEITLGSNLSMSGTTLNATGGGGGAPPDSDYGDITVALGVWTIDAKAVSLAKMADVATGSVFYRKTAATGVPEVQPLATLKTDLGLTGTNSGDQTITLTSDVTGSGSGSFATTIAAGVVTNAKLANATALSVKANATNASATPTDLAAAADGDVLRRSGTTLGFGTIATAGLANSAVTYAKIQNVSATDKLLGRSSAGAGVVEEITLTAAGRALIDDADATAQRATLGLKTSALLNMAVGTVAPGSPATGDLWVDTN